MKDKKQGGTTGSAIFLDREFREMVSKNSEAAWAAYCKLHGTVYADKDLRRKGSEGKGERKSGR